MSQKIIGVLGLGIFGQTLALELSQFGHDVIAIDSKSDHIQPIADQVSKAAVGDITDSDTLKHAGIDHCDAVVIATGNNLEAAVLAVMHCKKLGVPYIIAKAKSQTYEEVLYEIGANLVISPERESGRIVASKLMHHRIEDIYHLEGEVSIVEFSIPDQWVGKSVKQLNIRSKYDLNLIGTRTSKSAPLNTNIPVDKPLTKETIMVAIANSRTFESYDYMGYFE